MQRSARFRVATEMADGEGLPRLPTPAPHPGCWIARAGQLFSLAGALVLLISFTTNYGDDSLLHIVRLKTAEQIELCLHLAALAALAGPEEVFSAGVGQLATLLRHRAGALFFLEPSPLQWRFLPYVANELAGPPQREAAS